MTNAFLSPSRLHQVIDLYLAVAYAEELPPSKSDRQRALALARRWAPQEPPTSVEAMVDTAYVAARARRDVVHIARELQTALLPGDCRRLLADIGRTAQISGHLSIRGARVISVIRMAMG